MRLEIIGFKVPIQVSIDTVNWITDVASLAACDCSREGATSPVCSYATGQCDCRGNVPPAAPGALLPSDRQCRACLPDHYGLHTGAGCRPCECHPVGSEGTQCDDSGQCPCKDTVDGRKCDECAPAHFNLTAGGCM